MFVGIVPRGCSDDGKGNINSKYHKTIERMTNLESSRPEVTGSQIIAFLLRDCWTLGKFVSLFKKRYPCHILEGAKHLLLCSGSSRVIDSHGRILKGTKGGEFEGGCLREGNF